jgi:hypothetical protein
MSPPQGVNGLPKWMFLAREKFGVLADFAEAK